MKEIVVLGDKKLGNDLKHIMSDNFSVTQMQGSKSHSVNAASSVAVVRVHRMSDLDEMEGRNAAFIVVADSAEESLLDRAVGLGAKYFFVAPVSADMLALRLEWLMREEKPSAVNE